MVFKPLRDLSFILVLIVLMALACLKIDKLEMDACDPNRSDYNAETCRHLGDAGGDGGEGDDASSEVSADAADAPEDSGDITDGEVPDAACNQCVEGYFQCDSDGGFTSCVRDEYGCWQWSQRNCAQPFVCVDAPMMCVGPEFQVNTYTSSLQNNPVIGVMGDRLVVAWNSSEQDSSKLGVYGQILNSVGSKIGSEFQINQWIIKNQKNPLIGVVDPSRFFVVWAGELEAISEIYGLYGGLFDSQGQRLKSEFTITPTMINNVAPAIGIFEGSRILVVYVVREPSANKLMGKIYSDTGEPIKTDLQIYNNLISDEISTPTIGILDPTRWVVVWAAEDAGSLLYQIYGRVYSSAGDSISSAFRINQSTTFNKESPQLAVIDQYRWVVIWKKVNLMGFRSIYGRILDSRGAFLDSEFEVSNSTLAISNKSQISVLDSSRFAVIWSSWQNQVIGQIFDREGLAINSKFPVSPEGEPSQNYYDLQLGPISYTQWIVTWLLKDLSRVDQIWGVLIDSEGGLVSSNFKVNETAGEFYDSKLGVFENRGFGVIWTHLQNSDKSDILGRMYYQE